MAAHRHHGHRQDQVALSPDGGDDSAVSPEHLWYLSSRLHKRGWIIGARALKVLNFLLFHTVLPYEIDVPKDVRLFHRGLGTVIHPNTKIGRSVTIGHNVTITAGSQDIGSALAVTLEPGCLVGSGSVIRCKRGASLRVGEGAQIGVNAVVTQDVPPHAVVLAPASTIAPRR
jgi:serine O-acetyltransferase